MIKHEGELMKKNKLHFPWCLLSVKIVNINQHMQNIFIEKYIYKYLRIYYTEKGHEFSNYTAGDVSISPQGTGRPSRCFHATGPWISIRNYDSSSL